jgi:hypothetical protein
LFSSPSDARVSQTIQITISSPSCPKSPIFHPQSAKELLTPVDNPHLEYVITGWRDLVLEVAAAGVRDAIYFVEVDNFLDT